MSYWALTVITNLGTVVPAIGPDVSSYVWGGYYITSSTIGRFFCIHYILPFCMVVGIVSHLIFLHLYGSGGSAELLGGSPEAEQLSFYYYKDIGYAVLLIAFFAAIGIVVFGDTLHHADNFIAVDRFVTPRHIVPEWYFLAWYAILRACLWKAVGVLLLLSCVIVFLFLAGCFTGLRVAAGSSSEQIEYICTCVLVLMLGLLGGTAPVYPYVECSTLCAGLFGLLV